MFQEHFRNRNPLECCHSVKCRNFQHFEDVQSLRFLFFFFSLNAPIVHVKKFPFRIREKWLVMLVDVGMNIVIDQRAVPDLSGLRKVDLHLRPNKPRTGKYPYRVVVKCDSYLGADKMVAFELTINCDQDGRKKKSGTGSPDDTSSESIDWEIPDDDSDEVDPKFGLHFTVTLSVTA